MKCYHSLTQMCASIYRSLFSCFNSNKNSGCWEEEEAEKEDARKCFVPLYTPSHFLFCFILLFIFKSKAIKDWKSGRDQRVLLPICLPEAIVPVNLMNGPALNPVLLATSSRTLSGRGSNYLFSPLWTSISEITLLTIDTLEKKTITIFFLKKQMFCHHATIIQQDHNLLLSSSKIAADNCNTKRNKLDKNCSHE